MSNGMIGPTNIDDIRAEISKLENAQVFVQRDWAVLLMALSESPCRRADAATLLGTAKENQTVLFGTSPIEAGVDFLVRVDLYEKRNSVAVETEAG